MTPFFRFIAIIVLSFSISSLISCEKVIVDPRDQFEEPGGGNGDYKQEADEGIFFEIETTGEKLAATFVPAALYTQRSNETYLHGYMRRGDKTVGTVSITIVGKGTNSWDWGTTVSFRYTTPKEGGGSEKYYYERYKAGSSHPFSTGNVTITSYGKEREFVTGTFYLANSGEHGTTNNVAIRGRFKLRRNYDQ